MECDNFDSDQGFNRHSKGGNYLFCDGHVKWYPVGAVRYAGVQPQDGEQQQELCAKGDIACINGVNDGIHPTFATREVGQPDD